LLAPSSFSYFKIFLALHLILRWTSQPAEKGRLEARGIPVLVLGAGHTGICRKKQGLQYSPVI